MNAPAAIPLYGYQRRWIMDRARFKIGMMARQIGKTFTTTLEIVDDVYEAMTEGRRVRWVILSRGERQAEEAMREGVTLHAKAHGMAANVLEDQFRTGDGNAYRQLSVEFPGGSRVLALPANPDTARGFSANVFLDEFAIHRDSREIWSALFPVISAGWKLRVTSTPKGKGNKFYELMTGKDAQWSRHEVDIYRAVREGLPRDIDQLRDGLADPDAWAQEYECQWLDEASAWLSYDQICAVENPDAGKPGHYQGGPCFIGNDIAARNDLWVAWVWELVGDILWCREIRVLRRASFAEHDATMEELFQRYKVVGLDMDQTGMGEKPVEDMKRRYGNVRVQGVLFTGPSKLILATAGKQAFEDRKVRIPEGDPALRADLHSLQKIETAFGAPRFIAEKEGGSHADRTWAGFLGISRAIGGAPSYGYESANPARSGFDGQPTDDDSPLARRRREQAGADRPSQIRGAW